MRYVTAASVKAEQAKAAAVQGPINEAIYQAMFDEDIAFDLGRVLQGEGQACKWYEHEATMRKLSALAPDHLFELQGEGEESGDIWRKYFKGGKMQEARAQVTFDDFDATKLA